MTLMWRIYGYENIVLVLKYSRECMILSTKGKGRGELGRITYFHSTQFTVYSGVTHDP